MTPALQRAAAHAEAASKLRDRHHVAHAQTDVVEYYHTDVVGTVRLISDASGQVKEAFDYLPFGEAWPSEVTSSNTRRFAGKERDPQTGLDYFGARDYTSARSRFTTVDPVLDQQRAALDPQQSNRYKHRGARRIVRGKGGETYYTDDHYESFVKIDPKEYREP